MITVEKPTSEQKLRGVLEYCLLHGSSLGKVPKTKLFKLIYLADFSKYYFEGKSITDEVYKNRPHGPVPDALFALVDEMTESGDILVECGKMANFHRLAVEPTAVKYLTKNDIKILKDVCDYWKDKPTEKVEEFSHNQRPWFLTEPNEVIPYELILQETHPYKPAE